MISRSKYLIRLDDASPYSDLKKWNRLEKIFDKYEVKPIIASIPDNKDKTIKYSSPNSKYWEWIKCMDKKGWSIALHGYQHLFHKIDRKKNIFPYYGRSEFSGLSLKEQRDKIRKGFKIFKKNNIKPTVWVAPGHCFDSITLKALKLETDIKIISDGIAFNQYKKFDFHFIPQQLWNYKVRPFGLWTICLHPDTMSLNEINVFEKSIEFLSKKNRITSVKKFKFKCNKPSIWDQLYSFYFWQKYNLKLWLKGKNI